ADFFDQIDFAADVGAPAGNFKQEAFVSTVNQFDLQCFQGLDGAFLVEACQPQNLTAARQSKGDTSWFWLLRIKVHQSTTHAWLLETCFFASRLRKARDPESHGIGLG